MLKSYTYKPNELGMDKWPDGILRLNRTIPVEKPHEADIFIVPPSLRCFSNPRDLDKFPYMDGNEERHIFFDISDNFDVVYRRKCIFFRCNLKRNMLAVDTNSLAFPWPVDDFKDCVDLPEGGFKYDVGFQGWGSTDVRRTAARVCSEDKSLSCDITVHNDFYGYVHRDNRSEADRRMAEFKRSMKESRVQLCGQSVPGDLPYRFFEAMSAGRVPILFCSNYCLPWSDVIDYSRCAILREAGEAISANQIIKSFLETHDDGTIKRMGEEGREFWNRFLNRDRWLDTMTEAVEKKLQQIGIGRRNG